MALSDKNKEYLDGFGHGPGRGDELVDGLKGVLTDANVEALKARLKDADIVELIAKKAIIEAKLVELNK